MSETLTLERALGLAAYLVVRHGDAYVPILERLERELEEQRARSGHRDRAQRILSELMRQGITNAPAA